MTQFRVVDLRDNGTNEIELTAKSPEDAAARALDLSVTRSGSPKNLVCRVYWSDRPDSRNMVRLYQRVQ